MTETVLNRRAREVRQGEDTGREEAQSVPSGNVATYFVENPSSNDNKLKLKGAVVSAEREFDLDLHQNVTQDTAGTPMPEFGHFVGQPEDLGTVEFDGAYSGLDTDPAEEFVHPYHLTLFFFPRVKLWLSGKACQTPLRR